MFYFLTFGNSSSSFQDVLEMLRRPIMITVVFSENGTTPTELRRILVELGQPLSAFFLFAPSIKAVVLRTDTLDNNFGRFRRCFAQLQNLDYVFQAVVPGESAFAASFDFFPNSWHFRSAEAEWLNSNKSLRDYGFDASSQRTKSLQLTLLPVSNVVRRWKELNEPIAKKGWLWKQSGADLEKLSAKREKRFFVLTRTFLAYFKAEAVCFSAGCRRASAQSNQSWA